MKPAIKAKWVKALRSGKYRQTREALKNKQGYCCLGVLRELMPSNLKSKEAKDMEMLSRSQLEWAGLHHTTQNTLAEMNDGIERFMNERRNFKEIADYIEKRL